MCPTSHVVFLRGVNVGGRTLRTAELAAALKQFGTVNIGAAGTFVMLRSPGEGVLRREVRRRLPFDAEMMVVGGEEVGRLVRARPFGSDPVPDGRRRAVSILRNPLRVSRSFPFDRPAEGPWEVRVIGSRGPFVLSLHRRQRPDRVLYPNEVVEREFGESSTTRWWETIEQVQVILERGETSLGLPSPRGAREHAPRHSVRRGASPKTAEQGRQT